MRKIESFVKGLAILEYIASFGGGVRVSDVARQFSLPTSNVTLFLNSLVATGFVIKAPADTQYFLSGKILHMAELARPNKYLKLILFARAQMEHLHSLYDENVMLTVLNGFHLQIISRIQSTRNIQIVNSDEGAFIPHVTAGGKAILAFLPNQQIEQYFAHIDLRRFTPNTLLDVSVIRDQLEEIRRTGYAINRAEYEIETMAIAAPVFEGNKVIGALLVQFPTFRHNAKELDARAPEILRAAKEITERLASPHTD